jgi:hypothetical protein
MATNQEGVPSTQEIERMLAAAGAQGQGPNGPDEGEEEEEEEVEVEPGVIEKTVVTINKNGFSNYTITKGKNKGKKALRVKIRIPVPPTLAGYADAKFYGSEPAAKKAFDEYWARNKANSVRPVIRDADVELDWQPVAQSTADNYQPGKRGGYVPTIGRDELTSAPNIDAVIALLQQRGINIQ